MRRPARPFTVEIKSSRRSSQNAASALTGMPRTAPPPANFSPGEVRDTARERSPASLAALEEANRLFAKLAAPTPVSVSAQRSDAFPSEAARGQDEQHGSMTVAASAEPLPAAHDACPPSSLLPNLSVTALELGAPPRDTDQPSAPRNRHPRREASKDAQPRHRPEAQDGSALAVARESEPAVEEIGLSDQSEAAAVNQSAARASTPAARSSRQPRSLRALDQSWAYRAACRKAKRRGKPLPLRAAPRRKRT